VDRLPQPGERGGGVGAGVLVECHVFALLMRAGIIPTSVCEACNRLVV
jgi:hypothetical protein